MKTETTRTLETFAEQHKVTTLSLAYTPGQAEPYQLVWTKRNERGGADGCLVTGRTLDEAIRRAEHREAAEADWRATGPRAGR